MFIEMIDSTVDILSAVFGAEGLVQMGTLHEAVILQLLNEGSEEHMMDVTGVTGVIEVIVIIGWSVGSGRSGSMRRCSWGRRGCGAIGIGRRIRGILDRLNELAEHGKRGCYNLLRCIDFAYGIQGGLNSLPRGR